jgi:nucleotide-binding universal stress UspA family protein
METCLLKIVAKTMPAPQRMKASAVGKLLVVSERETKKAPAVVQIRPRRLGRQGACWQLRRRSVREVSHCDVCHFALIRPIGLHVAAQQPTYQYRSLLDEPEIKVTAPSGERVKPTKSGIHPATSFDLPPHSGTHTPVDSDTEADLTDIRRAQKLSFSMSQIIDTPESHRTIQIITRGEYSKLVQDAEDEHKRPRKYLVATDLSDESTHALEWAIGTVLRDGDTLLAIYCVDEETGIAPADGESGVPDQHKAMKDQAAAISVVANSKTPVTPSGSALPLHVRPSPLSQLSISDSASGLNSSPAPSSRGRSKATEERFRAVHDIGDRVTRLLRKTRLQVKVIVEVLHCKNPKHLITEVIDLVNPTLVILGSRGRSALKG